MCISCFFAHPRRIKSLILRPAVDVDPNEDGSYPCLALFPIFLTPLLNGVGTLLLKHCYMGHLHLVHPSYEPVYPPILAPSKRRPLGSITTLELLVQELVYNWVHRNPG